MLLALCMIKKVVTMELSSLKKTVRPPPNVCPGYTPGISVTAWYSSNHICCLGKHCTSCTEITFWKYTGISRCTLSVTLTTMYQYIISFLSYFWSWMYFMYVVINPKQLPLSFDGVRFETNFLVNSHKWSRVTSTQIKDLDFCFS